MFDSHHQRSIRPAIPGQQHVLAAGPGDGALQLASSQRVSSAPPAYEIEALVLRYRPRSLGARDWSLARSSAARVVLNAEPSSLKEAKQMACDLCALLASLPARDWDRRSIPDLSSLVTSSRIDALTSTEGMPGAADGFRARRRTRLRRLAQGVSGIGTLRTGIGRPAPRAAQSFWPAVAHLGSFVALDEAYGQLGQKLQASDWSGLLDFLTLDLSALATGGQGQCEPDRVKNVDAAGEEAALRIQLAGMSLRDAKISQSPPPRVTNPPQEPLEVSLRGVS